MMMRGNTVREALIVVQPLQHADDFRRQTTLQSGVVFEQRQRVTQLHVRALNLLRITACGDG